MESVNKDNNGICPVCGYELLRPSNHDTNHKFAYYSCPTCGKFQLHVDQSADEQTINWNHLGAYLVYHKYSDDDSKRRYNAILEQDLCDAILHREKNLTKQKNVEEINLAYINENSISIHMDAQMIDSWYPKTFSERVDYILEFLDERTSHIGFGCKLAYEEFSH